MHYLPTYLPTYLPNYVTVETVVTVVSSETNHAVPLTKKKTIFFYFLSTFGKSNLTDLTTNMNRQEQTCLQGLQLE